VGHPSSSYGLLLGHRPRRDSIPNPVVGADVWKLAYTVVRFLRLVHSGRSFFLVTRRALLLHPLKEAIADPAGLLSLNLRERSFATVSANGSLAWTALMNARWPDGSQIGELVRHLGQKIIHFPENISFVRDENVMIRIWQPNDTGRWYTSLKRICLC